MKSPNTFANNPLNRMSTARSNPEWVADQLAKPGARIVPFWQLKPLIALAPDGLIHAPAWISADRAENFPGSGLIFLGMQADGTACFAKNLAAGDDDRPDLHDAINKFVDLRTITPNLNDDDAAILAQARAMMEWHRSHRHCGVCGHATDMRDGGYKRACPDCGREHFPRTDPVVIMLVIDGDRALLGRGHTWPEGRYSALAGFLEPGETFEEAVRREIMEEAAIAVGRVSYHSSQPWPWPMTLMIGCMAEATTTEITIDPNELQDARWFDRDRCQAALRDDPAAGFSAPPPLAIAHQLLKAWVAG